MKPKLKQPMTPKIVAPRPRRRFIHRPKWSSVMITVGILLFTTCFGWVWRTHGDMVELRQRVVQMEDQRQQMRKFWRYGAFLHDQINRLRYNAGLDPVGTPPLGD